VIILVAVSDENVQLVRSMYEGMNESGDWRSGLEFLDPSIEFEISWSAGRDSADFQVLHGLDEVRRTLEELLDPFESARFELHQLRDAGNDVVATLELLVRPKDSAAEVSTGRFAYVMTLRGERITRIQDFREPADALRAAGLTE
jgi:ketosteroid isomerase-like protein